jgi:hypothetical protein
LDSGIGLQADSQAFLEHITTVRGRTISVHQETNGIRLGHQCNYLSLMSSLQEAGTAVPSFISLQLENMDPELHQQTELDIIKWAGASMVAGDVTAPLLVLEVAELYCRIYFQAGQKPYVHDSELSFPPSNFTLYSKLVSMELIFFLAMAKHQDIQRRAQGEIHAVVGSNRLPTFEDLHDLPYVRAIMKETLRWQAVAPSSTPFRVSH